MSQYESRLTDAALDELMSDKETRAGVINEIIVSLEKSELPDAFCVAWGRSPVWFRWLLLSLASKCYGRDFVGGLSAGSGADQFKAEQVRALGAIAGDVLREVGRFSAVNATVSGFVEGYMDAKTDADNAGVAA